MSFILGYTGGTLDRADHLRRDAQAIQMARMHPSARWLVLDDLKPVLTEDGSDLLWARRGELEGEGLSIFLGLETDGSPRFASDCAIGDLPGVATDARAAGMRFADGRGALIAQARSVLDWHRRHGFCAVCGTPTHPEKAGYSRVCPGCGAEHFPRVDPVVIMLALKDDMALVGRGPGFPPRFMSALAGFVEPGECLEEAVARELHEEVGLRVGNVRYLASQPWPFPSSLMMAAYADADGFVLTLDAQEIEEARWVNREECAAALRGEAEWQAPPAFAIAHTLLANWVAEGERTR